MPGRIMILDACQAISFGNIERIDLLAELREVEVRIGAKALKEVVRDPAASLTRAAVADGSLRVESIDLDDPEEADALVRFESMPAFRGRGDAEVLAIAASRGRLVGSDDEAILRIVRRTPGIPGFVSSLDVLVWAIREERLSLEEAERLIRSLDIGARIRESLNRRRQALADLI
ncbi:MAG TPA: hypothetical protein VM737_01430 [Gemmatimonadota bacterium]|nr:hypothetical protein [Gemmatimonadota bacterium]